MIRKQDCMVTGEIYATARPVKNAVFANFSAKMLHQCVQWYFFL